MPQLRIFRTLLLVGLPLLSSSAASGQELSSHQNLGLNDVYSIVLQRSEQDQIRNEDLAVAEARYRSSLSSYYPEVFLFGRKTYYDDYDSQDNSQLQSLLQQSQSGSSSSSSSTSSGSSFSRVNDPYQVGAGFRWPIFSGFQTYHESEARQSEKTSALLSKQRFRELLYRDVSEVYFQILEYQKTVQILSEEQQALLARIGELSRRVGIGRSSQGELLAARTEYNNSRVELERIRGLESTSRELLAFLMGIPADGFSLQNTVPLPEQGRLEAYLATVENRKDVLAAEQSVDAARARQDSSEGGYYPNANIEGSYYATQKPDYGRDWGITLSIEIPIFSGGSTYYAVKESDANLRKSKLELQALKRSASYEVRSAYVDFVNSLSRLVLLRNSVQISRSTYLVQLRDYRLGIVSNLEVLNALRNYHASRRELVRMEMLARMNEIRLHVAAGLQSVPDPAPSDGDTAKDPEVTDGEVTKPDKASTVNPSKSENEQSGSEGE